MTYDVYIGHRPVSNEPHVSAYDGDVHVNLSVDANDHAISVYNGQSGWLEWNPTQASSSVDFAGVVVYPIPSETCGLAYTTSSETRQRICSTSTLDVPAITAIIAQHVSGVGGLDESQTSRQRKKRGTPVKPSKPRKVGTARSRPMHY